MIVVAGEPRSGTSLMMMIVRELGFKLAGQDFTDTTEKDRNPDGFWEVWKVVNEGIITEVLDGKAPGYCEQVVDGEVLKLMTKALLQSDLRLISQMIYMIREPREVIVSQRGMKKWPGDEECWNRYIVHMYKLMNSIPQHFLRYYTLFVDYRDVMKDTKKQVERVARFLRVEPTVEAEQVVRPELYRSRMNQVKDNKYARKYYNALRACTRF